MDFYVISHQCVSFTEDAQFSETVIAMKSCCPVV